MSSTPSSTTAPVHDEPYSHSFWSRDPGTMRARKLYLTMILRSSLMVTVAILAVLSIYWGALWKTFVLVHGLHGVVVDFDGGEIGTAVTQAMSQISGPGMITWEITPASSFPNGPSDLADFVLQEKTWVGISINPGASQALNNAVASVDARYNGTLAITVYGEEARNENSYLFIIVPIITQVMTNITTTFTTKHAASLTGDVATLLRTAPQVVTSALSYNVQNIRPFDLAVGVAIDFVGLIYLLIVSFICALLNTGIRQMGTGLERRLTTKSLIAVRLIVPLCVYFSISLFYSLVSVAFQAPFSRVFGHAGFVIYWMTSFLGMCALGLAVEAMVTLLTVRFIPFFLILWIICNVSVSFFPIEVLPSIFRYGYATPFYNVSKAVRTILFNTKNELGLNFGVLFAWVAVSLVTIPVFQILMRRNEVAAWRKQEEARQANKHEEA